MDFHQSASERFAEQVFKYIVKEFDGKTINSNDCNLKLMIRNLPQDFDDFDLEECLDNSPITTVVEPNNNIESVNDVNESEPEIFQDNIDSSPKKVKKDKKNKKDKKKKKSENNESTDTENKPKRKPNAFINFRTSSENLDAIIEKSEEINEETGKKLGKVKAAGILWKNLSEEEQSKWK
jgi:hypothetical protein